MEKEIPVRGYTISLVFQRTKLLDMEKLFIAISPIPKDSSDWFCSCTSYLFSVNRELKWLFFGNKTCPQESSKTLHTSVETTSSISELSSAVKGEYWSQGKREGGMRMNFTQTGWVCCSLLALISDTAAVLSGWKQQHS